ncbi:hypothetical protein EV188_103582 [Actinomycetospora succinea]|uniref:Uncharacterized protein n=1 Tax=Actinomycetospora succinea TaxID=663603 RepID=A0A4R6VNW3_9PSEU|nr:hypothetical protein [Actinomycetospora succinea]TDQ61075.1 hypothetical protein EV188_103582 [Actinomycetospora succinea]
MDRQAWIRVTAVAALLGALAWIVKWAAIAAQGGGQSLVDVSVFFVGLVLAAIGSASLTLRLTRGRSAVVTTSAVVGGAVLTVLLVPGLSIVSNAVFGEGTVAGTEGGIAVLVVALLVVGVTGLRAPATRRAPVPAG